MIPKFLLIATLGLAPINRANEVEEPPTEETIEGESVEEEQEQQFDIKEYLAKWFEPSQIAMIMSWVAYAGTILGLVVKLRQLAKSKQTTAEQVKELVLEEIKKSVNEEIAEQVKPYLDGVVKVQKNTNEVMQVLSKVMALAQINDSASRLAILECIASLGVVDKDLLDGAKETIKENEKEKEENKEEALQQIDEIIEETDNGNDGTSI